MKLLILLFLTFAVSNITYCQKIDSISLPTIDRAHLLATSKTQRIVGWTIFGTGLPVVLFAGYFIATASKNDIDKPTFDKVFIAGAVYTLISVPLLISAGKNRKRALSVSLTKNQVAVPGLNASGFKMQSAISLTIPLHRG